jgi:hypothetical protein
MMIVWLVFVTGTGRDAALVAVAEAIVGTIGPLGFIAPEVAIADDLSVAWLSVVDVQPLGQQSAAARSVENWKLVRHGRLTPSH